MYKVLIIEDDLTIAKIMSEHLAQWGMKTSYLTEFEDILAAFTREEPQLVLLDIHLPILNGYHWCQEIRKISKVPIIFISSASDNLNIVMAMNMGGDDFIAKPFDLPVLVAKVQAMLRRTYDFGAPADASIIQYKEAILNLHDASLTYQDQKLELTKNDFRILQILMEHGGQVVSREAMMMRLWESDSFIDDNTLTVNVTRLRKKLASIGLDDYIMTKKGLGYII